MLLRFLCTVAAVLLTLSATAFAESKPGATVSFVGPPAGVDAPSGASPVMPEVKRAHKNGWHQPALGASASGDPEILFTFDDGPSETTEKLLDTLRAHGVKAIFFMVGHRLAPPTPRLHALLDRLLAEGHAIGNHTVSHRNLCLRSNASSIDDEIDDAARALGALTGMPVVLFRAPYGVRCAQIEKALSARGLTHMHWDVDPQEWRWHDARRTGTNIIHAIGKLRDGERAVILAHDTHGVTLHAVPLVLSWIEAENARRRAIGRREIRIIEPSEVAFEQLAPGLGDALGSLAASATELLPDLERLFVEPLTSARAHGSL